MPNRREDAGGAEPSSEAAWQRFAASGNSYRVDGSSRKPKKGQTETLATGWPGAGGTTGIDGATGTGAIGTGAATGTAGATGAAITGTGAATGTACRGTAGATGTGAASGAAGAIGTAWRGTAAATGTGAATGAAGYRARTCGVGGPIELVAFIPPTTFPLAASAMTGAPIAAGDRATPSAITGTLRRPGGEAGAGGCAVPIAAWQR